MTIAQTDTTDPRRCARCDRPARPGRLHCGPRCERAAAAEARRRAKARLGEISADRYPLDVWLAANRRPPLAAEAEADLARRALAGDRAARDELVMRNVRLIFKKIKSSRDRRQAALAAALRAAEVYDPDALYGRKRQSLRFTTYVGQHARWAALAEAAVSAPPAAGLVYLDAPADDPAAIDDPPARLADDDRHGTRTPLPTPEQAAEAAEADAAFDAMLAGLTRLQRQVVTLWLEHDGPGRARDIAAELGWTEHQVYGAWKRAKARLEARHALAA